MLDSLYRFAGGPFSPVWHVLILTLAAAPAGADISGFHYTRQVEVPAPGWVRVPLDLAALQHMAPAGTDLHVFGPAGGELPVALEAAALRSERRPLVVPRPRRTEDGWDLQLDAGADSVPHERLLLQAIHPPLSAPDRIESSADGSAWQPVAAGQPLRSGGSEDSGWTSVSFPATSDRFLRLHWPPGVAPRIAAAEVEALIGPTLSVTTRDADCDTSRPGTAFCTLALPAAGLMVRQLTAEITGGGNVGYRLDAPREARWIPLSEGVWQRSGGRTRHLLAGGEEPLADSLFRLSLYGSPQAPPRLASWGLEVAVQTVLFRAEEAGRYTVAYGGTPRPESPRAAALPAGETSWLEAGEEAEHAPPPLPAAATAPALRLGTRRLVGAWQVVAPSARPGFLVRLELPDAVYGAARADLGNLRLVAGERQIPFYRWSPASPARVAGERELEPTENDRKSGESEVELHLPELGLPLTELDLETSAALLRRTLAVRYLEPARTPRNPAKARREPQATVRDTWECRPQPPLPCRERLPLPGHAPQVLSLRFHDGDNPPLASVEADVWRRRDVLLFVWPNVGTETPVRLVAAPETLKAPSYDLGALGEALLSYPWQPAELSRGQEATAASEPWWSHWIRPVTLLLAAACLLFLLRRILMAA